MGEVQAIAAVGSKMRTEKTQLASLGCSQTQNIFEIPQQELF